MKLLFISIICNMILIGLNKTMAQNEDVYTQKTEDITSDSIHFTYNGNYPNYLTLYQDNSFKYFSMPEGSCWLLKSLNGTWHINQNILTLEYKESNFDKSNKESHIKKVQYNINDNKIILLTEPNIDFENSLFTKQDFKTWIYKK